jgi:hypothetical protein
LASQNTHRGHSTDRGFIVEIDEVHALHHHYERVAA